MAELVWTQADVDVLKTNIRRGILSVTFHDRTVVYHSLKEMRELLAEMTASVNVATTGRAYRLAATDKGV